MPDTRRLCPSDLSEEEWEIFEPLLVAPRGPGRPSKWLPVGRTMHTAAGEIKEPLRLTDEAQNHRRTRSV